MLIQASRQRELSIVLRQPIRQKASQTILATAAITQAAHRAISPDRVAGVTT